MEKIDSGEDKQQKEQKCGWRVQQWRGRSHEGPVDSLGGGDCGWWKLSNLYKVNGPELSPAWRHRFKERMQVNSRRRHAYTLVTWYLYQHETWRNKKAHTRCRNRFIFPLASLVASRMTGRAGGNCNGWADGRCEAAGIGAGAQRYSHPFHSLPYKRV